MCVCVFKYGFVSIATTVLGSLTHWWCFSIKLAGNNAFKIWMEIELGSPFFLSIISASIQWWLITVTWRLWNYGGNLERAGEHSGKSLLIQMLPKRWFDPKWDEWGLCLSEQLIEHTAGCEDIGLTDPSRGPPTWRASPGDVTPTRENMRKKNDYAG